MAIIENRFKIGEKVLSTHHYGFFYIDSIHNDQQNGLRYRLQCTEGFFPEHALFKIVDSAEPTSKPIMHETTNELYNHRLKSNKYNIGVFGGQEKIIEADFISINQSNELTLIQGVQVTSCADPIFLTVEHFKNWDYIDNLP